VTVCIDCCHSEGILPKENSNWVSYTHITNIIYCKEYSKKNCIRVGLHSTTDHFTSFDTHTFQSLISSRCLDLGKTKYHLSPYRLVVFIGNLSVASWSYKMSNKIIEVLKVAFTVRHSTWQKTSWIFN